MQGKHKYESQLDLFKTNLESLVSEKHSLVILSHKIDWNRIDQEFAQYYSLEGRPSIPTRTMVGLLLLKSMFNEADETLIPKWVENPYWQYFCGEQFFRYTPPCDPSDLVHFRKRIKKQGIEFILKISAGLHGKEALEDKVSIDTTVQEKDITFPTDAKLAVAILEACWGIAEKNRLKLHQSYKRKTASAKLMLRFGNHPKKKKQAIRAVKELKKYARKVMGQLKNQLPQDVQNQYTERFELFAKVLSQGKKDSHKIYSLHAPEVYCMSKGKSHKPYEFGCKVSVAITAKSGIIVGTTSFEENKSDVHTLEATLQQIGYITGKLPKEAICDRGYRGKKTVEDTLISIPKPLPASSTRYEKEKIRLKFRRRAAIEPIIGHLKQDHRMERNFLKGLYGDFVNCVLAAAGFNLKKMLRKIASSWDSIKSLVLEICYAIQYKNRYSQNWGF
jgi:IS5 family transposase